MFLRNDYIQMPPFGLVHDAEGYYSTLPHESVHWTRHESRLDRRFRSKSAQDSYAKEELVAEIGSAGPSSQLVKAGEDAGAAGHREPGDQERAAWLKHAHALVEEGRSLPQAWEAASVPSGDMAGALSGIRAATARIEAALLADERKAFGRLARSVNREVKETGVHFLDASAYRPLLESMQNLRKHDGLPDDTRALVAKWREADGRWKDERRQVMRFVEHARTLEKDHKAHALKAGSPAWLLQPLPDSWRREAQALLAEARKLEAVDTGKAESRPHPLLPGRTRRDRPHHRGRSRMARGQRCVEGRGPARRSSVEGG